MCGTDRGNGCSYAAQKAGVGMCEQAEDDDRREEVRATASVTKEARVGGRSLSLGGWGQGPRSDFWPITPHANSYIFNAI